MDRIAEIPGVADMAARRWRFHVCYQGTCGTEHAETGVTAVFEAGVRLHVLDDLVDVFGLFPGEGVGESYLNGKGMQKEKGEEDGGREE